MTIRPVENKKVYRLLNHGPTVMVSAKHNNVENVMSASWVCPLDSSPAKVTAVIDKNSYTRQLIEQSGLFAIQIPVAKQAETVIKVGTQSYFTHPNKLIDSNVKLFYQDGFDVPLVNDCAAWLICRLIPEPHNESVYDLLIGEVICAWADDRVFAGGHWLFDNVTDEMKNTALCSR